MNDKLAIYNQFDQMQKAAIALLQSGYFKDVTSQAQAMVKIMAGAEMGVGPWASMTGINIIQGKPTLGANLIATLVKNDPRYNYQVKQCNAATCDLAWFEDGKQVGTSTFTWDEAKSAGLTEKDNWRKYPSDMLFARCISRGARRFAPGIFGGSPVYTPDEMGVDTNEEGMIETVASEVVPQVVPANDYDPNYPLTPSTSIVPEEQLIRYPISNPAKLIVVPPTNGDMTLEEAVNYTDSKGHLYSKVSSAGLLNIRKNITLKLKEPMTQMDQDSYMHKVDAIKIILDARADGRLEEPVAV